MKKSLSLMILLAVFLIGAIGCTFLFLPKAGQFSGRKEWYWGVNGHHRGYPAYPEERLEEQLDLAKGMESSIYRFNFNARSEEDFAYLDKVVEGCEKRGMELLLVMDDRWMEVEEVYDRYYATASRYKSRIAFIQMYNELDLYIWRNREETDPTRNIEGRIEEVVSKHKEASRAIYEGSEGTIRRVINFAEDYTMYMDMLAAKGVEYDVLGWDWYSTSNQERFLPILESIIKTYGHDVIICEINEHPDAKDYSAQSQRDFILKTMDMTYHYPSDKLIGYIVYELYDEIQFEEDGRYNQEAHFGLVPMNPDFTPGEPKLAYYAMKEAIGGYPLVEGSTAFAVSGIWILVCGVALFVLLKKKHA